MMIFKVICLFFLVQSCLGEYEIDDPKLSELDHNIVREILTILTKGLLTVTGGCDDLVREDIVLYHYTRSTIQNPVELDWNKPGQLDTSKKIVVLIHGYLSGVHGYGFQELKDAYLERHDCNVIIVHWKKHARGLYTTSVCMLPKIAEVLADFFCRLSQEKSYNLEEIHFVGHSLGAQMSGLTGQSVKNQCKQTIGRITGLDPAGPLYAGILKHNRLDADDADFVDVIHTNGGVFGYLTSVGDVDYFPNCGILQFCKPFELSIQALLDLPVSVVTCHHSASLDYMAEAVRTDNFKGIPCSGCPLPLCPPILSLFKSDKPIMGEMCPKTTRGSYFVPVHSKKPYSGVE